MAASSSSRALDRRSHEPIYLQIADALTRQIAAGTYARGDRLPTEEALVRRHRVSRVTVRTAMKVLSDRHLIVRRPAKGTFVAGTAVRQNWTVLRGFYEGLVAQGFRPTMRLLEYRRVRRPPGVRGALPYSTVVRLVRQHWLGGTPLGVAYTSLHPSAERVSRAAAATRPSYRILRDLLHFTIGRADLAIRARPAGREPARLLEIRPGTPVLMLERTTYASSGEPLEHTLFYLRSDAYEFAFTARGPVALAKSIRVAKPVRTLEVRETVPPALGGTGDAPTAGPRTPRHGRSHKFVGDDLGRGHTRAGPAAP